ncbi:MAG TPA: hypothetical protein VMD53_14090 [Rhizomicrobium sp.]|nr:hypothetical protein [Rhizomicrobium sp.]
MSFCIAWSHEATAFVQTIKFVRPAPEGCDRRHDLSGKNRRQQSLQHSRPKLEIDAVFKVRTTRGAGRKSPTLQEVTEQLVVAGDVDPVGSVQHSRRRKPSAKRSGSDCHIHENRLMLAAAYVRRDDPRHEFGIVLDVRDKIEQLRRGIG